MNIPWATLALQAVLAVVLVGACAFFDLEEGQTLNYPAALFDSAVVFAALAFFFVVLRRRLSTPVQIFVAMLVGIFAGWALKAADNTALVVNYLGIFGELFILLLKMIIVPLVFVSVLLGVAGLGDVRKLGSLGAKTIGYFLCTTAIAVVIGLSYVNLVRPGEGRAELRARIAPAPAADLPVAEEIELPTGLKIQKEVLPQFLQNPIMPGAPILAIIFFALMLGAGLTAHGEKSQPAIRVFQGIDAAMVTLVLWIMVLAPIGVFALMAKAVATMGIEYIGDLALYCAVVVAGLATHFCVLTLLVVPFVARISPLKYLRGMAPAFQLAFTTSSSSATLPVNMDCIGRRVGVNRGVVGFVLPIGATINMDGTALYTAVASVFVAEVYGIDLGFRGEVMVFLTAIIVSVGTAGIPGASIGMMSIIFASAGIPVEGIGLVIGVDRILDMLRTTVNITGDSVGAAVVARLENAPPEPTEAAAA